MNFEFCHLIMGFGQLKSLDEKGSNSSKFKLLNLITDGSGQNIKNKTLDNCSVEKCVLYV